MSGREWECKHGVGHPYPSATGADAVHGCDGCCTKKGAYIKHPQRGAASKETIAVLPEYECEQKDEDSAEAKGATRKDKQEAVGQQAETSGAPAQLQTPAKSILSECCRQSLNCGGPNLCVADGKGAA